MVPSGLFRPWMGGMKAGGDQQHVIGGDDAAGGLHFFGGAVDIDHR
jgi:hypothetical protein